MSGRGSALFSVKVGPVNAAQGPATDLYVVAETIEQATTAARENWAKLIRSDDATATVIVYEARRITGRVIVAGEDDTL